MKTLNTVSYDKNFGDFAKKINQNFQNTVAGTKILQVSTEGIFEEYLSAFSGEDRQEHNCSCCKNFLRLVGGLVVIDSEGAMKSALWDTTQDYGYFNDVVKGLSKFVSKKKIEGVFITNKSSFGEAELGGWNHFYISVPVEHISTNRVYTPKQLMAEKVQDYQIVSRGITRYTVDVVQQALKLLETDSLYRSEKVYGPVKWLYNLHTSVTKTNKQKMIWKFVSEAPVGFCHITSNMASTLMDDIADGDKSFEVIAKRFADKMSPYNYMRPKATPNLGNIEQAEKIVEKLGIENSLKRRYATLEDLQLLWTPKPDIELKVEGGVFGSLKKDIGKSTKVDDIDMSAVTITWEKFKRKVLDLGVDKMEVLVPTKTSFVALLTEEIKDSPNILQWSNPVSWYVYGDGSLASQWNLQSGSWVKVSGLSLKPNQWNSEATHQGEGVIFLLEGCKDTRDSNSLALFPEILKSELHSVRSTIEMFSNKGILSGKEGSTANGILLGDSGKVSVVVKVTTNNITTKYNIDRLD